MYAKYALPLMHANVLNGSTSHHEDLFVEHVCKQSSLKVDASYCVSYPKGEDFAVSLPMHYPICCAAIYQQHHLT